MAEPESTISSFLGRHEFLLRRLHSLTGLVPVGAYLVIHLATNASVLSGPEVFQANVDKIHALGPMLPVVEWAFIFLPILFHALFGFVILWGGLPNNRDYNFAGNARYAAQRVTGVIAFLFIGYHLWHMHYLGKPLGGGNFDPHHATSSAAAAISGSEGNSFWIPMVYAVGVLACVYHLANGIWTAGITWGIWISPRAQRGASWACAGFGVLLAAIGLGALSGMTQEREEIEAARQFEERWERQKEMLIHGIGNQSRESGPKGAQIQSPSSSPNVPIALREAEPR